jgi:hypothetical protein
MKTRYERAFGPQSELIEVGSLHLPTGRIVASDPFLVGIAIPFERAVTPGDFGVQLSRIDLPGWGRRIAMARVLLCPSVNAEDFVPAKMKWADSSSYYVQSGLGSFMDESTRERFAELMAKFYQLRPEGNYYDDVLAAEFKRSAVEPDSPDDVGNWSMHVLAGSPTNVAMFASGLGDGTYESYWAVTKDGEAVALVTDFGIIK